MKFSPLAPIEMRIDRLLNERWRPWQAQLAPREQQLLRMALIAVPLIVLIFGIVLPLKDRQVRLQKELAAIAAQAQEAEQLAERALQGGGVQARGELMPSVEQAAGEFELRDNIVRIKPVAGSDNRLQLTLKDVPYNRLISFLTRLDGLGISVPQAALHARTTPGTVDADLTVAN